MANQYHLQNIHTLLNQGFTHQELRQLCRNVPDFTVVLNRVSPEATKASLIDALIKYADQHAQMETILIWAKMRNPARYKQHSPYYTSPPHPFFEKLVFLKNWASSPQTNPAARRFWAGVYLLGTILILSLGFGLLIKIFG